MEREALVLSPTTPETVDRARLAAMLAEFGLLGAPLAGAPGRFHAGPRIMELLAFLGCSPTLNTDPAQPGFCYVEIGTPPARDALLVWGIGDGLALPSDELLAALEALGSGPWRHHFTSAPVS